MNEISVLLVFLSIAVAFAGFTGVVALIDRRAAHVSHDVISFRVRNLVICVVIVMTLSILPSILLAFGILPHAVWRIGCGAIAAFGLAYIVGVVRARARLTGAQQQGLNTAQFNTLVPLGLVVIVGLIVAAAGVIAASGMYLVGVFYFVLAITSYFVRLVLMLDESARNAGAR